ncbi:hypothetical protein [Halobellus marinus]|jgi:hypothetical protein|uniref:hypothetical protein n=1 Tax=Halobellus TaxID=1073986 RepID=UPI0028B10F94|nr:hypothetical protein [Halobellus sp. DFY28]
MVTPTRRALLHGAAGLATGLAGCSEVLDGSTESTRTAPQASRNDGSASGSVTDPEIHLIRVDTDRPPIWLAESNSESSGRPTPSQRNRWRDSIVVDGPDRADSLDIGEPVDREQVESFVAATDFTTETVYVEMGAVEECFRLDLCHISWTPSSISTDYTRRTRPYTAQCAVDEWVTEARLIRIPDAIEADNVNKYSSSIGTGTCDRYRGNAGEEARAEPPAANENAVRKEAPPVDSGGSR